MLVDLFLAFHLRAWVLNVETIDTSIFLRMTLNK